MSEVAGPSTTDLVEQLRAQLAQAEDRVREHEATIAALSVELDETNHGVVALYAELDDNAIRLREVSDLKSRFLSYMSHEFRTPLGSILSIARLLLAQMDGPLTEEQRTQVTFINTSASELTEMVNDLLDLAKVEAGRITISPAWFDMVDLFSALRGMFKPILASSDVSLVFEEPRGVPAIFTDDRKLSQILRNFISNALKFTHPRRGAGDRHARGRRSGAFLGDRHGHRHSAGASPGAVPGLRPGGLGAAEAPARHRAGPLAEQEARGHARRRRHGDQPGWPGLDVLGRRSLHGSPVTIRRARAVRPPDQAGNDVR